MTDKVKQYMSMAICDAENMWQIVRETYRANPQLFELSHDDKINLFYEEHKKFYEEFPIVSRYMIVHYQYDREVFTDYLKKKYYDAKNIPEKRDKKYMEDQWIKRESGYICALWYKRHRKRVNEHDRKKFQSDIIKSLKKEFDDFREMHDKIKTSIEIKDKEYKYERMKEIGHNIEKITSPNIIGAIPEEENIRMKKEFRDKLLIGVVRTHHAEAMMEISSFVKTIEPVCIADGKNIMSAFDTIQYVYEKPILRMHQLKFNPVLEEIKSYKN